MLDASKPDTLKLEDHHQARRRARGLRGRRRPRASSSRTSRTRTRRVAIDIKTHKAKSTWNLGCGDDGPRGVAVDAAHGFVFVACTDHVHVLDGAHDGAQLGELDTGAGRRQHRLARRRSGSLRRGGQGGEAHGCARRRQGSADDLAVGTSADGARNGVADAEGNAYVADPLNARLLVFRAPK